MEIVFEELKIDDLEELKELYYLCFNIDTNINKMKEVFLNTNDLYTKSFVLKFNNKIIGHIKCDIINNIFGDTKPYAYFSDICIHPNHRGKGYSKHLIKYAEDFAKDKNCSYMFLTSSNNRLIAHNLYTNLGYEKRDSSIFKKII